MRVLAACLAGLVAGCSFGPDYRRPEVALPAAWEEQGDAGSVWPDPLWWRGFANPELSRIIADATAANFDLAAALARIQQAEAQAQIAGASLYPSVTAGAGAARTRADRGSGSSFSAGLLAAYQVDLFGANAAARSAALARVEASRFDREAAAITLHSAVTSAYFQILATRDRLRLSHETLGNAEEVLSLLESRRRLGLVSDLEVAQQRSALATQRAALPALEQVEVELRHALALLLGRNPEGFDIAGRSLAELTLPAATAGDPSALLRRRPDIRRAEAELRAAHLDMAATRADAYPTLDLSAQATSQAAIAGKLFSPATMIYDLAASLTAPIFSAGRLEGERKLAEARYRELVEGYRSAVTAALADVEDALSASGASMRGFEQSQEAQRQAQEAYRIVAARFRAGGVDFLTVLDAQRTVLQANDAVVQAALERCSSLVALFAALGGGWDAPVAS
jgi:NodT family efflux transporter outer membrane factor (OMF) lipoprotein